MGPAHWIGGLFREHWDDSNPASWRVGGFFVAVIALGGLVSIVTSTAGLIRASGEGDMVSTAATVVRVQEPETVILRFIHVDGEPRTTRISAWRRGGLSNPMWRSYQRGDTISIYYDPADPALVFKGTARDFAGRLPLMLTGIALLVGAVGLSSYGYRRYRAREYSDP